MYCRDPSNYGVVERNYRHILETAWFMLLSASVPTEFWCEIVLTGVRLINPATFSHILGISFEKIIWTRT